MRDLDAASHLLDWTIKHSVSFHFRRSVVVARCLQARLAVLRDQNEKGLAFSQQAAGDLWRAGLMPAVRSEEVYLTHYEVLLVNDKPAEAWTWLRRASDVLEAKAASIHDAERRRDFRERVKTSRSILSSISRSKAASERQ